MKFIWKLIKGVLGLVAIGMIFGVGYMFWDEGQLEQVINGVAQNIEVGSSAYNLTLPSDRTAFVSFENTADGASCGSVVLKNGIVRHAKVNELEITSSLKFQQGIDLTAHADKLALCDKLSILTMSKAGFL